LAIWVMLPTTGLVLFLIVSNNRRRVKLVLKDIEFIRCPYVLIF
jgi:hypothetical protein